ncbi:MAG TPA: amino acid permease, partial [Puia sp.]|nr:amino acid permease [Puia sp.]
VKTLALLLLVVGLLFSGKGSVHNYFTNGSSFNLSGWPLFAAFMAATTGAFASYDGWVNVNMVAGEIKDPDKNLTRSLIFGLFACILVYVVVNLAYIYMLSIDAMAVSKLVAADAAEKALGVMGGSIIALLIVISAFGASNVNLLASARVTFAMGQSKTFFPSTGRIHPRFQTPGNAVVVMTVISSLFVLSGSFDILADMFVFMSWVFYLLTVIGVFILRKKMPDLRRPYKVSGYPWIPWIFIVFTLFYIGSTLFSDVSNFNSGKSPLINSVFGILLTMTGVPFYWYFKRKNNDHVIS